MSDPTGGLYPFLGEERTDPEPVLDDVRSSTLQKARDVSRLRRETLERNEEALVRGARLLARAARGGGKVLAFGNGGSATDAQDLVADLTDPPRPDWRPLPALSLVQDRGVVTAVANDVGFAEIFARQIIACAEPGDVAVGFSTSGESENVVRAFREAGERGVGTLGFAGYEGGRMAEDDFLDAVVVAPSSHVPRIQEAHATAYHSLLAAVQELLAGGASGDRADRTGRSARATGAASNRGEGETK